MLDHKIIAIEDIDDIADEVVFGMDEAERGGLLFVDA